MMLFVIYALVIFGGTSDLLSVLFIFALFGFPAIYFALKILIGINRRRLIVYEHGLQFITYTNTQILYWKDLSAVRVETIKLPVLMPVLMILLGEIRHLHKVNFYVDMKKTLRINSQDFRDLDSTEILELMKLAQKTYRFVLEY
jgi:hypothetical protein